jgi:hypothetical protein
MEKSSEIKFSWSLMLTARAKICFCAHGEYAIWRIKSKDAGGRVVLVRRDDSDQDIAEPPAKNSFLQGEMRPPGLKPTHIQTTYAA